MTYAEFLKSQGASDDDLKVLDTPIARKAWEAQLKAVNDAQAAANASKAKVDEYQKWYEEVAEPTAQRYMQERDIEKSNRAAVEAQLKSLQESGLIKMANQEEEEQNKNKGGNPPNFDPNKYVTLDTLTQVADREGDAIAIAQDIAFEHARLFPEKPLNFRQLRKDAVAQKKSVEALWMEQFGVTAAREARAKSQQEAHEKKIAEDAVNEYKKSHATSNPNLLIPSPSSNPFTGRLPSQVEKDTKPPWQRSDADLQNSRVNKVLSKHPELLQ